MSNYTEQTEELVELGENPIIYAIEDDDEKYLIWLLKQDIKVKKDILDMILNIGYPVKYIKIILDNKPAKYFDNPLKSAILAEDNSIINLLVSKGFPIDENVMLAVIDEDNVQLLDQLLPRYKGNINDLFDSAMIRGAKETASYLKEKGATSNKEKEKEQCEKDEEGNVIDPISAEIIPTDRLITIKEGKKVFCFDLDSLYKFYRSSGKFINPINNVELPKDVITKIRNYAERNLVTIIFKSEYDIRPTELTLPRDTELGQILFDINEKINIPNLRGRQNLGNLMLTFDIEGKTQRIYQYDLTIPMNNLNFGKSFVFIVSDISKDPYINIKHGELYPKLYKYASGKNIIWADHAELIPEIYRSDPSPQEPASGPKDLKEFSDILLELNDPYGILDFVNNENIKILAEDTQKLIDIIDKKFKELNDKDFLKHLIYSRVVDKQNLKATGIARYYIRNLYQQPDYKILYE
jgi:hypothetical protein